ncbi:hypothetical protein [Ensifer canadensis]
MKSIEKAGYKPGEDMFIALDCAASLNSSRHGKYVLEAAKAARSSRVQWPNTWRELAAKYPIFSIEKTVWRKTIGTAGRL